MSVRAATCCDVGGIVAIGASLFGTLPTVLGSLAALLSCIWFSMQIWEAHLAGKLRRLEARATARIEVAAQVAAQHVLETAKSPADELK